MASIIVVSGKHEGDFYRLNQKDRPTQIAGDLTDLEEILD